MYSESSYLTTLSVAPHADCAAYMIYVTCPYTETLPWAVHAWILK